MANIKTELKWRKKSTFNYKDPLSPELEVDFTRYVLVCGMIVFTKAKTNGELSWSPTRVISEREFPQLHHDLEAAYVNAVIEEPLSKQEVTFSK
jgi:hypothetical protein